MKPFTTAVVGRHFHVCGRARFEKRRGMEANMGTPMVFPAGGILSGPHIHKVLHMCGNMSAWILHRKRTYHASIAYKATGILCILLFVLSRSISFRVPAGRKIKKSLCARI